MRSKLTMFAALTAVTVGCIAAPQAAHAQKNRGELVSATAKLNQAQMALVKKLADDPAFADQFNAATSKGNASAVADLVSQATGVPRSSIAVQGTISTVMETPRDGGLFHLASMRTEKPVTLLSGEICFDFGKIRGCISL